MHLLTEKVIDFSLARARLVSVVMVVTTLLLVGLAVLPSVWPQTFSALRGLQVDTDPENMLAADEPVRVFHNQAKRRFGLHDMIVVGVVNETDEDGVFNPATLARIDQLASFAEGLQWPDEKNPELRHGVISIDMIAPGQVDDIRQAGLGSVSFSWLMPQPPQNREAARELRDRALRIPLLRDTLISHDGKALALYLPLSHKDVSHAVREALLEQVADWPAQDQVHITGLPVAEDTFGVEMFYQMAISAPLAMLMILLLMAWFFRHGLLIIAPMIVAMVAALSAMALLVISGQTVHIMSSMIPIFVMPIAVLDAVHILSEFFDVYPRYRTQENGRHAAIREVMTHLFKPMLFTSLTTTAGFASLALTPIPPVQVFGLFVAMGVMLAWLWSILFIPAYIHFIPEAKLARFGHAHSPAVDATPGPAGMARWLPVLGAFAAYRYRWVMGVTVVLIALAVWGISRIEVNDNPTRWFRSDHPIRVADRVMNEHFAGTYMAYLQLQPSAHAAVATVDTRAQWAEWLRNMAQAVARRRAGDSVLIQALEDLAGEVAAGTLVAAMESGATQDNPTPVSLTQRIKRLQQQVEERAAAAPWEQAAVWDEVWLVLDEQRAMTEVFKQPAMLEWLADLQQALASTAVVGKVNGLPDIVKTVHRELLLGEEEAFRIPTSAAAVAQTLLTFESSHRPQDLWHFVTPDFRQANLWLQLNSGDNRDMETVVNFTRDYLRQYPPPLPLALGAKPAAVDADVNDVGNADIGAAERRADAPSALDAQWFGLTFINSVWQEKMVSGMRDAFLSSFVVVLVMMGVLFRSVLWGLLSMVPLMITVTLIYGMIGWMGKDYDMPVAVLSSLSLGLAVDYAIHFLVRTRELHSRLAAWPQTIRAVFGEPARAISRNAIVLGAGFLPLLAAPLVPYQTVGAFIAAIIFSAGVLTLVLLPALMSGLQRRLLPQQ